MKVANARSTVAGSAATRSGVRRRPRVPAGKATTKPERKSKARAPGSAFRTPHSAFRTPHSALPSVVINMSMSADGKIATANRAVESFSSRRDHEALLQLRATADAVMCGARTAETGGVTLGTGGRRHRQMRLRRGLREHPLRVVVSGSGRVNTQADVFRHRTSPLLVLTTKRVSGARLARLRQVADEVVQFGVTEVDLRAALGWLRRRWKVKRMICEGGGELNDAMFRAGLVDELRLTVCPVILGGRTAPTIADGLGCTKLAEAIPLRLQSARVVGGEMFLVFRRGAAPTRHATRPDPSHPA